LIYFKGDKYVLKAGMIVPLEDVEKAVNERRGKWEADPKLITNWFMHNDAIGYMDHYDKDDFYAAHPEIPKPLPPIRRPSPAPVVEPPPVYVDITNTRDRAGLPSGGDPTKTVGETTSMAAPLVLAMFREIGKAAVLQSVETFAGGRAVEFVAYLASKGLKAAKKGGKVIWKNAKNEEADLQALANDFNKSTQKEMKVGEAGHHVPAVRKAQGRPFSVDRSDTTRPTFHVVGDEKAQAQAHWRMHNAERDHIGPRQGDFNGTDKELFDAYRNSYTDLTDIRVDVRSPDGKTILGTNVTLEEAINWDRATKESQFRASGESHSVVLRILRSSISKPVSFAV
jgi:hypothetical protein